MATRVDLELVEIECGECGIWFGMSNHYIDNRKRDHRTWYCPNGHGRAWLGESTEEKLKRELRQARDDKRFYMDLSSQRYDEAEAAKRSAAARKGVITRMKNRALAGGCVFCRRNFANVAKHMETKHADETAAVVE